MPLLDVNDYYGHFVADDGSVKKIPQDVLDELEREVRHKLAGMLDRYSVSVYTGIVKNAVDNNAPVEEVTITLDGLVVILAGAEALIRGVSNE